MAYLAGYFDGEGCITFCKAKKKYPTLTITLVTADEQSLLKFEEAFGGQVRPTKWGNKPVKRQLYLWQTTGHKAQAVLRQLLPYLVTKKEIAQFALLPTYFGHGHRVSEEELALRQRASAQVSSFNQRVTVQ